MQNLQILLYLQFHFVLKFWDNQFTQNTRACIYIHTHTRTHLLSNKFSFNLSRVFSSRGAQERLHRRRESRRGEEGSRSRALKMGWAWRDETGDLDSSAGDGAKFNYSSPPSSTDRCSTRKVVKSQCKTEEVEPGKFVRKCERTEEILRDCIGRYVHVCFSDFCCPVAVYFNLTIVVFRLQNCVFYSSVKENCLILFVVGKKKLLNLGFISVLVS